MLYVQVWVGDKRRSYSRQTTFGKRDALLSTLFKERTFRGDIIIWKPKPVCLPNSFSIVARSVTIMLNESCIAMPVLTGGHLNTDETMVWKTFAFLVPWIGEHGIRAVQTVRFLDCSPWMNALFYRSPEREKDILKASERQKSRTGCQVVIAFWDLL